MNNFKTTGCCSLCNTPLAFEVGDYVDSDRWKLLVPINCSHCKATLYYALRDSLGRFWGRERLFND